MPQQLLNGRRHITYQDVDLTDTYKAALVLKFVGRHRQSAGYIRKSAPFCQIGTFALVRVKGENAPNTSTSVRSLSFTLPDNDPSCKSLAVGQNHSPTTTRVTLTDH